MRMPEFTAVASIYKTGNSYSTSSIIHDSPVASLVPQARCGDCECGRLCCELKTFGGCRCQNCNPSGGGKVDLEEFALEAP